MKNTRNEKIVNKTVSDLLSKVIDARTSTDDICDAGWAPEFAAASVLHNIRPPNGKKSNSAQINSAIFHWRNLQALKDGTTHPKWVVEGALELHRVHSHAVFEQLSRMLTDAEKEKLKD